MFVIKWRIENSSTLLKLSVNWYRHFGDQAGKYLKVKMHTFFNTAVSLSGK